MNDFQQPNQTTSRMNLERLEQALDIYGADLSRMPGELKKQVEELVENDQQAKALLKEAAGLDKALDNRMPEVKFDLAALENKIMAAVSDTVLAEQNQDELSDSATILDMQKWKKDHGTASSRNHGKTDDVKNQNHNQLWKSLVPTPYIMSSGLIAASLLCGVFFGSLGGVTYIFGDTSTITMASLEMTDDLLYLSSDDSLISDTSLSLLSDTIN